MINIIAFAFKSSSTIHERNTIPSKNLLLVKPKTFSKLVRFMFKITWV